MKQSASVEIDCPIDDVFRLTNDHVAEWSIIVVEDEVIEQKPDGVGTTFRTVTEERGRRMEFDGIVTRHEPPNLSAVHLTGKMFDIDTEYRFEDLSGRTRVTQFADVTGKGVLFKLMMFIMGPLMHKSHCEASHNELESLKRFCESHVS